MIDALIWLSVGLGVLLLVAHGVARWQCSRKGHQWQQEFHPHTGLRQPRCRRCRRWPDAT